MISIVTVNHNSYDWFRLMLESLERQPIHEPYKIVLIDNSINPKSINEPNVYHHINNKNIGHGAGLNLGVQIEQEQFYNPFVLFLDIDCHAIGDWQWTLLNSIGEFDIIAGKGVPEKPIRPACMFMKSIIAQSYDWRDTPGYKGVRATPEGFDVAIQAYYQMVDDNVFIKFMDSEPNHYGTLNGEEWCVDGKPLFYHHWSGTWLKERQIDFPNDDLFEDKEKLFSKIPWRVL